MKPEEMMAHCKQQQVFQNCSDAMVTFVLTGIRGENRRLFGRSGPIGHVVGHKGNNSVVAFKADEVLGAFIDAGAGQP